MEIKNLVDLNGLRSAPQLSKRQMKKLFEELETNILDADWITIGIMAPTDVDAVAALTSISNKYSSIKFRDLNSIHAKGNVFLKGNQKTGNVFIRSENGSEKNIINQYDEDSKSLILLDHCHLIFLLS